MSAPLAELINSAERVPVTEALDDLPTRPGVYLWWLADDPELREELGFTPKGVSHPLYVGTARKALSTRVPEHLRPQLLGRTEFRAELSLWLWGQDVVVWSDRLILARPAERSLLLDSFESDMTAFMKTCLELSFVPCPNEVTAGALERHAILEMQPFFNRAGVGPRRLRDTAWYQERVTQEGLDADDQWRTGWVWAEWMREHGPQIDALGTDRVLEIEIPDLTPARSRSVTMDAPLPEGWVRLAPDLHELPDEIFYDRLIANWWGDDGLSPYTGRPYPSADTVIGSLTRVERRALAAMFHVWEWFVDDEAVAA